MRLKHNKKRNTAFLFEALVNELTKAAFNKEEEKKNVILVLIKEYFGPSEPLGQELGLYKTLNETKNLDVYTAERLVQETRNAHQDLNQKVIFEKQTSLVNKINKRISSNVYSNFVPNYKNLATISQMFGIPASPKEKVLLERRLIQDLTSCSAQIKESKIVHVDKLVYKNFVSKFNEKYGPQLIPEQKQLMKRFLRMFEDNGLSLKVYLNEEVHRLKKELTELSETREIKEDRDLGNKIEKISELLESYKGSPINDSMIKEVLKIQALVEEAKK